MPDLKRNVRMRAQQGSGFVEALAVGMLILVITLALVDLIVLVLANGINDTAAKNAARAAANQVEPVKQINAAKNSIKGSKASGSGFITSLKIKDLFPAGGNITCITEMKLKLPIPVPGVGADFTFVAQDTEPIVGH